ncbi:MAG: hypothetical protein RI897_2633 [Verrucomicrobiota bacterium]|jgi:uncharacterized protein
MDNYRLKCHVTRMLDEKYQRLQEMLKSYGSCVTAYSGGVDSVFLAVTAAQVLGSRALAVIADSASLPRRELDEAVGLAHRFQVPVRVIRTEEFANPDYLANPLNRCYFCKQELFSKLVPLAREEGYQVIIYGENASDAGDVRPGLQAAKEFDIRAPLKEAGLTKAEIRELSARRGLPTADKPQMACLSSRIPHGEEVNSRKLGMVETAENLLRDEGFFDVRVRHHTLTSGDLARIEVGAEELQLILSDGRAARLAAAIQKLGYMHVTLDLRGYRRGNAKPDISAGGVGLASA